MKHIDRQTQAMIRRLAGMPDEDRKFVLGRLGPAACERLAPLLSPEFEMADFSPPLQNLIEAVSRGDRPTGMTAKGATALRAAAAHSAAPLTSASPRKPSVSERIFDLLKRGG